MLVRWSFFPLQRLHVWCCLCWRLSVSLFIVESTGHTLVLFVDVRELIMWMDCVMWADATVWLLSHFLFFFIGPRLEQILAKSMVLTMVVKLMKGQTYMFLFAAARLLSTLFWCSAVMSQSLFLIIMRLDGSNETFWNLNSKVSFQKSWPGYKIINRPCYFPPQLCKGDQQNWDL